MKIFMVSCLLLAGVALAEEQPSAFQECFQKDSISCVQMAVFRKAKEFFEQPQINLVAGLSVVKNVNAGKSLDTTDVEVESANDVEGRSNAIENFFIARVSGFFQDRSLNWNFVNAARSLSSAIPDDVKASVRSLVVEARGKKKILKSLMPILGIVKLKVAILGILALLGIGMIAKKALLLSTLSIIISLFVLIKKIISKKLSLLGGEDAIAYHGGGGLGSLLGGGLAGGLGGGLGGAGWQSGGGWNSYEPHYGDLGHGGHGLAYGGHHKA